MAGVTYNWYGFLYMLCNFYAKELFSPSITCNVYINGHML